MDNSLDMVRRGFPFQRIIDSANSHGNDGAGLGCMQAIFPPHAALQISTITCGQLLERAGATASSSSSVIQTRVHIGFREYALHGAALRPTPCIMDIHNQLWTTIWTDARDLYCRRQQRGMRVFPQGVPRAWSVACRRSKPGGEDISTAACEQLLERSGSRATTHFKAHLTWNFFPGDPLSRHNALPHMPCIADIHSSLWTVF
ncbi:MAG: hypothetical protein ACREP4_06785 [Stenotrophomonas sp.]|uniref:hypothetical protein n=1 Tax=Stenotrophomonas sp. TaxID=69392 RepID=UPI003D6CC59F